MKLCMIVVPDAHEDQLLNAMRDSSFHFTQIEARAATAGNASPR